MKKNNVFAIDVDDTILQWKEGFLEWLKTEYNISILPEATCDTWDMSKWFGITYDECLKLIVEFNSYPRVLKPMKGAKEVLMDLKDYFDFEIVAITSFGSCPIQTQFRKDYLDVVFEGIIDEVIVLELGSCKKKVLETLKPKFFVEDNKYHAEKALELGITTFLITTPYNRNCEDAIYVDNWYVIEDYFN